MVGRDLPLIVFVIFALFAAGCPTPTADMLGGQTQSVGDVPSEGALETDSTTASLPVTPAKLDATNMSFQTEEDLYGQSGLTLIKEAHAEETYPAVYFVGSEGAVAPLAEDFDPSAERLAIFVALEEAPDSELEVSVEEDGSFAFLMPDEFRDRDFIIYDLSQTYVFHAKFWFNDAGNLEYTIRINEEEEGETTSSETMSVSEGDALFNKKTDGVNRIIIQDIRGGKEEAVFPFPVEPLTQISYYPERKRNDLSIPKRVIGLNSTFDVVKVTEEQGVQYMNSVRVGDTVGGVPYQLDEARQVPAPDGRHTVFFGKTPEGLTSRLNWVALDEKAPNLLINDRLKNVENRWLTWMDSRHLLSLTRIKISQRTAQMVHEVTSVGNEEFSEERLPKSLCVVQRFDLSDLAQMEKEALEAYVEAYGPRIPVTPRYLLLTQRRCRYIKAPNPLSSLATAPYFVVTVADNEGHFQVALKTKERFVQLTELPQSVGDPDISLFGDLLAVPVKLKEGLETVLIFNLRLNRQLFLFDPKTLIEQGVRYILPRWSQNKKAPYALTYLIKKADGSVSVGVHNLLKDPRFREDLAGVVGEPFALQLFKYPELETIEAAAIESLLH